MMTSKVSKFGRRPKQISNLEDDLKKFQIWKTISTNFKFGRQPQKFQFSLVPNLRFGTNQEMDGKSVCLSVCLSICLSVSRFSRPMPMMNLNISFTVKMFNFSYFFKDIQAIRLLLLLLIIS